MCRKDELNIAILHLREKLKITRLVGGLSGGKLVLDCMCNLCLCPTKTIVKDLFTKFILEIHPVAI
jgi:hypothetical protein